MPELDHARCLNLHGQVRHAIPDAVKAADGALAMFTELARAQERFGVMYKFLDRHFRDMAEYYTTLAGEIDGLSAEEKELGDVIKDVAGGVY